MKEENIEIILAHLRRESGAREQKEFNEWLAEDKSRQADFEQIRTLWEQSGRIRHLVAVDPEADWRQVRSRFVKRRASRSPWAAAAAIALLVGLAVSMYYFWPSADGGEHYAAADGMRQVVLVDGSLVHLNQGASISVDPGFGERDRIVTLTGEAFFEVARDPAHPFVVEAGNTETTVLGTAFNIAWDEQVVHLQVDHGRVRFASGGEHMELHKGMAAESSVAGLWQVAADPNTFAWRTGVLRFDGTALPEVVSALKEHYRLNITLPTGADRLTITSVFDNQPLSEVLEEIALVHALDLDSNASGFHLRLH